jgi:hypothetical protein
MLRMSRDLSEEALTRLVRGPPTEGRLRHDAAAVLCLVELKTPITVSVSSSSPAMSAARSVDCDRSWNNASLCLPERGAGQAVRGRRKNRK